MRHLFVINPAAKKVKGRVDLIKNEIVNFFAAYPDIRYDIYTSSWCRDAVSYIRRYIMETRKLSGETVRIHAVGGTGTLFEAVNGVIGFSNVQVAAHPYGSVNAFNRYFGQHNYGYFNSLKSQVFDGVIPVDVIRGANNYGICFAIIGLEALCDYKGDYFIEKGFPSELSYIYSSIPLILGKEKLHQTYRVEIDGKRCDGDYVSIFIANIPCYGKNLHPGVEAHPDDGKLDIYLTEKNSRLKLFSQILPYMRGDYSKVKTMFHFTGKNIKISAQKSTCMNIDSETFFGASLEIELIPAALSFVCPKEIDIDSLPFLYNKPESGRRVEKMEVLKVEK